MKRVKKSYLLLAIISLFSSLLAFPQFEYKKKGDKWLCLKNSIEIIPPIYDTILPFDETKNICMACVKSQKSATNKFIKTNNMVLMCKYLNDKNEMLILTLNGDTTSFFNYSKISNDAYRKYPTYFSVLKNEKKYLVNKDFKQVTQKGYDDIYPSGFSGFYVFRNRTVGMAYLEGILNQNEEIIIPAEFTEVTANPFDSLFIACTAQLKLMGEDYVFNVNGKKLHASYKHIDNATKNFLIHKIFEPKEHYVIYSMGTKKDKIIYADQITYLGNDEVNIKIKKQTHRCNLFQLDEYKFLNHEQN